MAENSVEIIIGLIIIIGGVIALCFLFWKFFKKILKFTKLFYKNNMYDEEDKIPWFEYLIVLVIFIIATFCGGFFFGGWGATLGAILSLPLSIIF